MVLWLEQYLNQLKGVLVMVTHDRYFLDRVTNKIVEIDEGKLYSYEPIIPAFSGCGSSGWPTPGPRSANARVF